MPLTPTQLWNNACKYDHVSPKSPMVSFSAKNPWAKRYDKVAPMLVAVQLKPHKSRSKKGNWEEADHEWSEEEVRKGLALGTNTKLGKEMLAMSMPKGVTCGGKTKDCEACYGNEGMLKLAEDQYKESHGGSLKGFSHFRNLDASQSRYFVPVMVDKLDRFAQAHKKKGDIDKFVFRFHPFGDAYSNDYIKKLIDIADASKKWKFYGYTRAWQQADLRDNLEKLGSRDNVKLLASTDTATGKPPKGWFESGMHGSWTGEEHQCDCDEECYTCGRCADKKQGGTKLQLHSVEPKMAMTFQGRQFEAKKGGLYVPDTRPYKLTKGRTMPSGNWSKKRKSKRATSRASRIK